MQRLERIHGRWGMGSHGEDSAIVRRWPAAWWFPGPFGLVVVLLIGTCWNLSLAAMISMRARQLGPSWPPLNNADERELPEYLKSYGAVRASTTGAISWTGIGRTDWWLWSRDVAEADRTATNAERLDHAYVVLVLETGWPLPTVTRDCFAIYEWKWSVPKFQGEQREWLKRAGLRAGVLYAGFDPQDRWDASYFKVVPVIPIWTGLVGGGVFWAGVWWVPVVAWRVWRRRRAVRGGRCPACGYERPRNSRCPECGANPA